MTKYLWKGDPEAIEQCDIQENDGECSHIRGLICPGFIDGACHFHGVDILEDTPEYIVNNLERVDE